MWRMLEDFAQGANARIQRYLSPTWGINPGEVAEAAQFIRFALTRGAVAAAAVSTPKLEACLKRDGSREAILECLRRHD
jgi:hypothetical protein